MYTLPKAQAYGILLGVLLILLLSFPVSAGPSGLPLPRFVSLRSNKVNLRRGPGTQYPIDWVFVRAGLPVEVISEFETWRKIRDLEGAEGWVHQSMLSGKRTIITLLFQDPVPLMKHPNPDASLVARVQGGVIGYLKKCENRWCCVRFQDQEGWLLQKNLWGVRTQNLQKTPSSP